MKQKYEISISYKKNELIIKEFAELEKIDIYTLLCEESYDAKNIKSAMSEGKKALIAAIRTINFYPPALYAEKIVEAIKKMYSSKKDQSVELFFNDLAFMSKDHKKPEKVDETQDASVEIDELLEEKTDEIDELLGNNNTQIDITRPVRVEANESLDIAQES